MGPADDFTDHPTDASAAGARAFAGRLADAVPRAAAELAEALADLAASCGRFSATLATLDAARRLGHDYVADLIGERGHATLDDGDGAHPHPDRGPCRDDHASDQYARLVASAFDDGERGHDHLRDPVSGHGDPSAPAQATEVDHRPADGSDPPARHRFDGYDCPACNPHPRTVEDWRKIDGLTPIGSCACGVPGDPTRYHTPDGCTRHHTPDGCTPTNRSGCSCGFPSDPQWCHHPDGCEWPRDLCRCHND